MKPGPNKRLVWTENPDLVSDVELAPHSVVDEDLLFAAEDKLPHIAMGVLEKGRSKHRAPWTPQDKKARMFVSIKIY